LCVWAVLGFLGGFYADPETEMKVQKREERRLALDLLSKSLGWEHGNMCRKD